MCSSTLFAELADEVEDEVPLIVAENSGEFALFPSDGELEEAINCGGGVIVGELSVAYTVPWGSWNKTVGWSNSKSFASNDWRGFFEDVLGESPQLKFI